MSAPDYLARPDVEALLGNWERLNADMMGLPITAIQQLIREEVLTRRRPHIINRLYGRFNRLRRERELRALSEGETWPVNLTPW